jgi:hypothetical protein
MGNKHMLFFLGVWGRGGGGDHLSMQFGSGTGDGCAPMG